MHTPGDLHHPHDPTPAATASTLMVLPVRLWGPPAGWQLDPEAITFVRLRRTKPKRPRTRSTRA